MVTSPETDKSELATNMIGANENRSTATAVDQPVQLAAHVLENSTRTAARDHFATDHLLADLKGAPCLWVDSPQMDAS